MIKFRSLTSCTDFVRAIKIIETGKFHCSKLWDLNDPMEGIYKTTNISNINGVFDNKNRYVICSFSSEDKLKNSLLWGYYANGYKGMAIEIDWRKNEHGEIFDGKNIDGIDSIEIDKCIVKVNYIDKISKNKNDDNTVSSVPKIISTKLNCWEHEEEYRYLEKSDQSGLIKIGKIEKVHFGNPYGDIINKEEIIRDSKTLICYNEYVKYLWQCCIDNHIKPEIFNGDLSEEINVPDDCTHILSQNTNRY